MDDGFGVESGTIIPLQMETAARVKELVVGVEPVRNELDIAPWRDILIDLNGGELADELRHALVRDVRPQGILVGALDHTGEADVPYLLLSTRKAQAAKRDSLQHDIAIPGDLPFGIPHSFPTGVVTDAVGGASIELNAVRIGVEPIAVLMVLKSVDDDADTVVGVDLLAGSDAGANLGRIVFADPADVQVLAIVGKIRRGGLANGLAVVRVELFKDGDDSLGLAGRSA